VAQRKIQLGIFSKMIRI